MKEFDELDERVYENYDDMRVLAADIIVVFDKRTNGDKTFTINDFLKQLNEEERLLHQEELAEKIAQRVAEIIEERNNGYSNNKFK